MPKKGCSAGTAIWRSAEEQFDSKWQKNDETGCWDWKSTVHYSRPNDKKSGYGVLKIGGRAGPVVRAHRFAYERWIGPIPERLHVCHTCDNPLCVNPGHLFIGTNADNVKDKTLKGRAAKRLSKEEVLAIRSDNDSHRKIGQKYGVTHTMVGYIKRGHSWSHVQET